MVFSISLPGPKKSQIHFYAAILSSNTRYAGAAGIWKFLAMHAQESEEREAVSGKLAKPKVTYGDEKIT